MRGVASKCGRGQRARSTRARADHRRPSGEEHEPARSEEVKSVRLYTLSVSLFRGVASQVTRGTHREQPFGVPLPGRSALPRPRASRVAKWHFHVQVPRYLPALRGAFPPATVPCAHCPAGPRGKARVRRLPTRLLRPRATPAPAGAPREVPGQVFAGNEGALHHHRCPRFRRRRTTHETSVYTARFGVYKEARGHTSYTARLGTREARVQA